MTSHPERASRPGPTRRGKSLARVSALPATACSFFLHPRSFCADIELCQGSTTLRGRCWSRMTASVEPKRHLQSDPAALAAPAASIARPQAEFHHRRLGKRLRDRLADPRLPMQGLILTRRRRHSRILATRPPCRCACPLPQRPRRGRRPNGFGDSQPHRAAENTKNVTRSEPGFRFHPPPRPPLGQLPAPASPRRFQVSRRMPSTPHVSHGFLLMDPRSKRVAASVVLRRPAPPAATPPGH